MNYWLPAVLTWLPKIFFGAVFLLAAFLYFKKQISVISYKLLVVSSIAFHLFYAVLLTAGQYYVWSQSKFTRILLNSPLDSAVPVPAIFKNYFLFYSYSRFWLNALVSIGIAFAFYLFLKSLQKHRERFFEAGETELGFLSALIVGWPNIAVFVPLVFVFVILASVFRRLIWNEFYTTLGWPFIFAAFVALIWGSKLIDFFNLAVLRI